MERWSREATGWSVRKLAALMGLPQRTTNRYVEDGLVSYESRSAATGRSRRYTIGLKGIQELVTIVELRRYGLNTRAIKKAVVLLRELSGIDRPLAGQLTLVVAGDDLHWVRGEATISLLKYPAQSLLAIKVSDIYDNFMKRLRDEDRAERLLSEPASLRSGG